MIVDLSCDYCHSTEQQDLFVLTLTNLSDTKDTCTKIICQKCSEHFGKVLDAILNKRDINEVLSEIENDIIEGD